MIIIFDTETNGLPKNYNAPMRDLTNWPRVIQLAWQLVDHTTSEVVNECKALIKPDGWKIPTEKFWIENGYSTEQNEAEGFEMDVVLNSFLDDYNQATHLIAHNLNFDYNITGAEMIRYNKKAAVKLKHVCTMQSSIQLCKLPSKFGYKYPKLIELHQHLFNEGFDGAHDALADVNACRRSLFELVNRGVIKL